MPIKGLTDEIVPRLPSLGKLHKGGEKPERGPGKDLEYFRFAGVKPDIEEAFAQAYGRTPGSLTVYLPFEAADDCFSTWQEEWGAGGLLHRCDGQVMQIWRTEAGGYSREPKPCPYHTGAKQRIKNKAPGCDEVGRLVVILPELIRAGHVGTVTLETHSKNDMLNILSVLKDVEARRHDLRGVLFTLYRRQVDVSTPTEEGTRVTRKKWLVFIEPSAQWVQVHLALAHAQAMALPSGEVIDGETGEIIERAALPAPTAAPQLSAPAAPMSAEPDPKATSPAPAAASAGTEAAPAGKSAADPAANSGKHPTQAMWDKLDDLNAEAKGLGIEGAGYDPNWTAGEVAQKGAALRKRIEAHRAKVAQAAKQPAAPVAAQAGNGKRQPTRTELLAKLKEAADEAKSLNVIGPAWAPSPKWTDDEIIDAGRSLKQQIRDHKQKEPAHANA